MVDSGEQNDLMFRPNMCWETTFCVYRSKGELGPALEGQSSRIWKWDKLRSSKKHVWFCFRADKKVLNLTNPFFSFGRKIGGLNRPIISIWPFFSKSLVFFPGISTKRRLASSCTAAKLLCDWRFVCSNTKGGRLWGGQGSRTWKWDKLRSPKKQIWFCSRADKRVRNLTNPFFRLGEKIWGPKRAIISIWTFFSKSLVFLPSIPSNDGWHLHAQRQNYGATDVSYVPTRRGASSGGNKVREHENGIKVVHPKNRFDFVPAPTKKCWIWQIRFSVLAKKIGVRSAQLFQFGHFFRNPWFLGVNFHQTTVGIFMRSDKIIVRLTFRMSQHKAGVQLRGRQRSRTRNWDKLRPP